VNLILKKGDKKERIEGDVVQVTFPDGIYSSFLDDVRRMKKEFASLFDIKIKVKGRVETIGAHKAILFSRCPEIREIVLKEGEECEVEGLSFESLEKIVNLCYCLIQAKELKSVIVELEMLSKKDKRFGKLKERCEKMILQRIRNLSFKSLNNNASFSDLTLLLEEEKKLLCHKVRFYLSLNLI